jgi:hypothetical protein
MEDKSTIEAALQQVRAERKRREDERVEKGEAVRVPLSPAVVGVPEGVDAALADMKARKVAEMREKGDLREAVFESEHGIDVIMTGVPRHDRDSAESKNVQPWPTPPGALPGAPGGKTPNAQLEGDDVPPSEPRSAPEWQPIWTQVRSPSERNPEGVIEQGQFLVVDGELRVRNSQGKEYIESLKPGEDHAAAARRKLREVYAKTHTAFCDPIIYPARSSYH